MSADLSQVLKPAEPMGSGRWWFQVVHANLHSVGTVPRFTRVIQAGKKARTQETAVESKWKEWLRNQKGKSKQSVREGELSAPARGARELGEQTRGASSRAPAWRPDPAPAAPALPAAPAPLGPWGPAGALPPSGSAAFPWSRPCRRRPARRDGSARRPRRCRRRRPPPAPCRRRCGRPRYAAAPARSCAGSARSWLRRAGPRGTQDLPGLPLPPSAAPDRASVLGPGTGETSVGSGAGCSHEETGGGGAGGPGVGGADEGLYTFCGHGREAAATRRRR